MRVDYANLGPQADEPFWKFIGCCLISRPEILSSGPDLGDLQIEFSLNGESVDLLRAWQLFTEHAPAQPSTVQAVEGGQDTTTSTVLSGDLSDIKNRIRQMMEDFTSAIQSLDSETDNAIDYAASAAADVAADYARDRVHEEARENLPSFSCVRDDIYQACSNLLEEIETHERNQTTDLS